MPKINAQEYFPNNESIHSKTIIILHLQMPKFMLPNSNYRKWRFTDSKRKSSCRWKTVTKKNTVTIDIDGNLFIRLYRHV
jgi:hypothetical protein